MLSQTLWLDQRGTGLSAPLSLDTLPENMKTDEEIARYLKHFRADSIGTLARYIPWSKHLTNCRTVKDCEVIRKELLGSNESPDDRKWTLMGQSFGGFCCITYLSFHSEGIKEVFIAGGLAPLVDQPDEVYEALTRKSAQKKKRAINTTDLITTGQVVKRNNVYYKKYPQDIIRVR